MKRPAAALLPCLLSLATGLGTPALCLANVVGVAQVPGGVSSPQVGAAGASWASPAPASAAGLSLSPSGLALGGVLPSARTPSVSPAQAAPSLISVQQAAPTAQARTAMSAAAPSAQTVPGSHGKGVAAAPAPAAAVAPPARDSGEPAPRLPTPAAGPARAPSAAAAAERAAAALPPARSHEAGRAAPLGQDSGRALFDGDTRTVGQEAQGRAPVPVSSRDQDIGFNGIRLAPRVFSHKESIKAQIIKALNAAKVSAEIALHGIEDRALAEAVIRAKDRGVAVRVLMNQSHVYPEKAGKGRAPEVDMLIRAGVEMRMLRGAGPYGILHNKFAVLDGKLLETGSFNWTYAADKFHFENIIFSDDGHRVRGFKTYWDWMWQRSREIGTQAPPVDQSPVADKPPADSSKPVRFRGRALPAYAFTPDDALVQHLVAAVDLAKESIEIAMFSFTLRALQEALLKARDRGVRVSVVFDEGQFKNLREMRWFVENGFDVRISGGRGEKGKGVLHNKFAVFDRLLAVTGSFNWTFNGLLNNFENENFLDDPADAEAYAQTFEDIRAQARVPTLADVNPMPEPRFGQLTALLRWAAWRAGLALRGIDPALVLVR